VHGSIRGIGLEKVSVFLEVNIAYDGNEAYPAEKLRDASVSGQPALIYKAEVCLNKPGVYPMKIVGHSSPTGGDGKLYTDMSGITTAFGILESVEVIVE